VPQGTTNWPNTSARPPALYQSERDSQHPAEEQDFGTVENSGGSAKVIPENSDFENKGDRIRFGRKKEAIRMDHIRQYVSEAVRAKAKNYTPKLKRVDKKNMIWTYQVGKWEVKAKVSFSHPRMTDLRKADLHLTCSCPFWRWQGPEHWGKEEDYLRGTPRGTASFPIIRDPEHEKAVCKHVYAVFSALEGVMLARREKKGSTRPLLAAVQRGRVTVSYEGREHLAKAIVRRYMRGECDGHL